MRCLTSLCHALFPSADRSARRAATSSTAARSPSSSPRRRSPPSSSRAGAAAGPAAEGWAGALAALALAAEGRTGGTEDPCAGTTGATPGARPCVAPVSFAPRGLPLACVLFCSPAQCCSAALMKMSTCGLCGRLAEPARTRLTAVGHWAPRPPPSVSPQARRRLRRLAEGPHGGARRLRCALCPHRRSLTRASSPPTAPCLAPPATISYPALSGRARAVSQWLIPVLGLALSRPP